MHKATIAAAVTPSPEKRPLRMGSSLYDVRKEGEGWSKNTSNWQTNSTHILQTEGQGVKESQNRVDIIYGSP